MRRGPGRWSASRSRVSRREAGARSGRAACEPPGSADRVHRPDDCASPPTSPVTEGGQVADAPARFGGGRDHYPGGATVVSDPAPAHGRHWTRPPGSLSVRGPAQPLLRPRTGDRAGPDRDPGRRGVRLAHASGGGGGVHRRRDGGDARRGPTAAHAPRRGGVPHPAGDTPQRPGPGPGTGRMLSTYLVEVDQPLVTLFG